MTLISTIVTISMLLSGCDISITINQGEEPVSESQPQTMPEPSTSGNPPTLNSPSISQSPTTAPDKQHDLYAGFTNDEQIPFVILHESGEQLAVAQDIYSNQKTGVVWSSPGKDSIAIYSDGNGIPTYSVVSNSVIRYTNYTNSTVDITVTNQDGTKEVFRVKYNAELIKKIQARHETSYHLAALAEFSNQELLYPDAWDYLDYGFMAIGAVSCAGLIATANPALLALASTCGGLILDVAIEVMEYNNIDVELLEANSTLIDGIQCLNDTVSEWSSCAKLAAAVAENTYNAGNQLISDFQNRSDSGQTNKDQPKECKGKYNNCP